MCMYACVCSMWESMCLCMSASSYQSLLCCVYISALARMMYKDAHRCTQLTHMPYVES